MTFRKALLIGTILAAGVAFAEEEIAPTDPNAIARETLEETGWTFVPREIVGIYLWQPAHLSKTFLRVAFCGQLEGHDPSRPLDHGILRTRWLDREQLAIAQARHRSPLVARCVDDYLGGARYPLELLTHLMRSVETADTSASIAASG